MPRTILIVAASLVGLVVLIVAIGAALPVKHTVSRTAPVSAPPDSLFSLITDFAGAPSWRPQVERVELLGLVDGKERFREIGSDGAVLFEVVERSPPSRLVTRIADPKLPFGGQWVFDISPSGAGSSVTITEQGEVYNPLFRFMSRFVFGHARTIERYLRDLRGRLAG